MQEIGSVRFVSKELRHSALKAWQLLLKQDNLYAPAISDDSSDDGGNAGQRNEMKEAARLIVDFVAQGNNHVALDWHTESERSSKSSAILANIGDADLDSVRAPLEMLSQLKTSDQAEYMKTVGTNLLLDSFHLTKITANRPLFTAGMMALKHHNLIADLRINEDAVARFLIKVEDG